MARVTLKILWAALRGVIFTALARAIMGPEALSTWQLVASGILTAIAHLLLLDPPRPEDLFFNRRDCEYDSE